MALYIAVYDIHPADRKHFERLLNREADKRKQTGETLYVEVFGSQTALLSTPHKYDLFIIDSVDPVLSPTGTVNLDTANVIRETGSASPIAMFFPDDVTGPVSTSISHARTFKKPVTSDVISSIIDWAVLRKSERVPKLELRGDTKTLFVTPDEFLYAVDRGRNAIDIVLTEDRSIHLTGDLIEVSVMLDSHDNYLEVGRHSIINMDHVSSFDGHSFTMKNGEMIQTSFFDAHKVASIYESYKS